MNILFIGCHSPYESVGGVERYVSNLINYYKDTKKHKTFFILPTSKESCAKKVGELTIYFNNNIGLYAKKYTRKEINDKALALSKDVEKVIHEQKIDVIIVDNLHTNFEPVYTLLLNMVAFSNNVPLILRIHTFSRNDMHASLVNGLMWKKISCVSKSVAEDCYHKGTDIDTLITNYLGVDTRKFNNLGKSGEIKKQLGLPANSRVVLTASRIYGSDSDVLKEKGIINLIQAFSRIAPRHPELRLVIAVGATSAALSEGFDQAYDKLMGYIRLNNISDITAVKVFEPEEMPTVYRDADVFVLPSESETFGQVFIEAMACGVPVIGTKVGGIPEIISDSINGFLVIPNDPIILSQRMETLLNDTKLRKKFIKSGLEIISSKFSLDKQLASFTETLEEIVAESKPRG